MTVVKHEPSNPHYLVEYHDGTQHTLCERHMCTEHYSNKIRALVECMHSDPCIACAKEKKDGGSVLRMPSRGS